MDETPLAERVNRWFRGFREAMSPTNFVCCFDSKTSWRKLVSPEYKIARLAKPPDEMKIKSLAEANAMWRSMGLATAGADGYEADDAAATLAARFASPDVEVVLVSSDKDWLQCVGDNVKQWDVRPNKAGEHVFYDAAKVEERHGVPPHRLAELLAICGDQSDSVAGIKGIGKVQATVAIRQTRSADEIFRKAQLGQLKDITANNQKKFIDGRADFNLALQLVTLQYDAPIDLDIEDTTIDTERESNECAA